MRDELEASLKQFFGAEINGVRELLKYVITHVDKMPALINSSRGDLEVLTNEKFKGIESRFGTNETALAAALQAARELGNERDRAKAEAIAKSEASTTKLLEGLAELIKATAAATDAKIEAQKDRIGVVENMRAGSREQSQDSRASNTSNVNLIGMAIMAVIAFGALLVDFVHAPPQQPTTVYVAPPTITPK
jgi:hypothetical protein